jgi:hypothetical protein
MLNMNNYFDTSTKKQCGHQRTYEWTPLWRVQVQVPRKHDPTAAVDQLIGIDGREGQALVAPVVTVI